MSPKAGQFLIDEIAPILKGTLHRAFRQIGAEDLEEIEQDALAQAANMVDAAERNGKSVPARAVAFYVIQRVRSGRRSTGTLIKDVFSPAAQLEGRAVLESLDAELEVHDDCGEEEPTLHSVLADTCEDTDVAAARRIDWGSVMNRLDERRQLVLTAIAEGFGPNAIAGMIKTSAPYVCQLREELGEYVVRAWGTNGVAETGTPSGWRAGLRAAEERRAGRSRRMSTVR